MLIQNRWVLVVGILVLALVVGLGTSLLTRLVGIENYYVRGGLAGFLIVVGILVLNGILQRMGS